MPKQKGVVEARPPRWLFLLVLFSLIFFSAFFIGTINIIETAYTVCFGVFALMSFVGICELLVSRVQVHPDHVLIKGLFSLERIPISKITKIDIDLGVSLYLKSGQWKKLPDWFDDTSIDTAILNLIESSNSFEGVSSGPVTPGVVLYSDSNNPVLIGDHVEVRGALFPSRKRNGRVIYVPGISKRHPDMDCNGLTYVGIDFDDEEFAEYWVDPQAHHLQDTVNFLSRDDSEVRELDPEKPTDYPLPEVVLYSDGDTRVLVGDHVEIRGIFPFSKGKSGRVIYVPGISRRHPDMDYEGFTSIGVDFNDGVFVDPDVNKKTHRLHKQIKFLRRGDSDVRELDPEKSVYD